mmetsp:Transcript_263/g.746  ORF Transcript_263/g.746 Transcript_263/m.746 type:complete len:212 (-) Transcript_263:350-985(-)
MRTPASPIQHCGGWPRQGRTGAISHHVWGARVNEGNHSAMDWSCATATVHTLAGETKVDTGAVSENKSRPVCASHALARAKRPSRPHAATMAPSAVAATTRAAVALGALKPSRTKPGPRRVTSWPPAKSQMPALSLPKRARPLGRRRKGAGPSTKSKRTSGGPSSAVSQTTTDELKLATTFPPPLLTAIWRGHSRLSCNACSQRPEAESPT